MAVVVTYSISPNITGTTPPTAAQAAGVRRLSALVSFADADTVALVTHNWGFTTTQLANLQPMVSLYVQSSGTASGLLSVQLTNSVAITISKGAATAGTGGTICANLAYPHSLIE